MESTPRSALLSLTILYYKDTNGGFDEVENDNEFAYHSPVEDEVDSDFSIDENDEPKSDLGTIHILRKHFFCQNERISISTLHFDEIFILYFDIWQKKKKIAQKIRENVEVDIKALFSLKRKNFYFNITFWQNFHSVVWHLTKKKKNAPKICENVEVD